MIQSLRKTSPAVGHAPRLQASAAFSGKRRLSLMTAPDSATTPVPGVTARAPVTLESTAILTPEALTFLATLHREFNHRRVQLLEKRVARQAELDSGARYDFLPE